MKAIKKNLANERNSEGIKCGAFASEQWRGNSCKTIARGIGNHVCCRRRLRLGLYRRSHGDAGHCPRVASADDSELRCSDNRCAPTSSQPRPTGGLEKPLASESSGSMKAAGNIFSAIALITGSTVGAGMLALPQVTAPAGFVPTTAGLGITWAMLTMEALLLAEVNLDIWHRTKNSNEFYAEISKEADAATPLSEDGGSRQQDVGGKLVTLRQMAEETLGAPGKGVTVVYLGLSYGLLVAYITKAAEIIDGFVGHMFPAPFGSSMFVFGAAMLFLKGGSSGVDRLNQIFTSLLFALFAVIISTGVAEEHDIVNVLASGNSSWSDLPPALPIILLSLVYHDLVPVICSMLGGRRKDVRTAIVLGSLVPLAMFTSWEAVALSMCHGGWMESLSTSNDQEALSLGVQVLHETTGVDPLEIFISKSGPVMGTTVQGFSFLAVVTSFFGTTLGLSETLQSEVPVLLAKIREKLHNLSSGMANTSDLDPILDLRQSQSASRARSLALALTLLPPLIFTSENPDAFLTALSVAGGTGMTLLYCILPPIMAWKIRKARYGTSSSSRSPSILLPGGNVVLVGLLMAAIGVGLSGIVPEDTHALLDSIAFIQTNFKS